MGERFLVLDEAAAALDAVDPQSAAQFRLTNGLPAPLGAEVTDDGPARGSARPVDPAERHEIRMVVGDRDVRCDCSCGTWASEVGWDAIDAMVVRIRQHLGSVPATSADGIQAATAATLTDRRVG
jgi:hypothetical protein